MREQGAEKQELDRSLELEPELEQVLRCFRQSVHALSEAAYSRPRTVATPRRVWRLTATWALSCLLTAGAISTALYQHQHPRGMNQAAQRTVQQLPPPEVRQGNAQAQATRVQEPRVGAEDDALMAKVDTDVSRQVPSAMEPLAQLLAEDESE